MEKHIWLALVALLACVLLLCGCGNSKPEGEGNGPCVHDFGEWIVESQATCKEEGLLIRHCTKCDYVESSTTEITNVHTEVIDPEIPATCEKNGLSEGKHCSVCDMVLVARQETPIVPHTYDDKYDESCNVCGHIRDAECAHKETEIIEGKAATCTENGLTDGSKCKKCGELLVAQTVIPMLKHSFGAWVTVKEATIKEEGLQERTCSCGAKETQVVEKLPGSLGLSYTKNSDGNSYSVSVGSCTDAEVIIPAIYEGLPVTAIGGSAFAYCSSLTSISIPDSVTSIGNRAFNGCSSLTGIWVSEKNSAYSSDQYGVLFNKAKTELINAPGGINGAYIIPNSVIKIGNSAFAYCTSLTNMTIPNSVTEIGDSAFDNCVSLTNVTINNGVNTVGSRAFNKCSSLISITIPNSVTVINNNAFYDCTSLKYVSIGDSVETIGKYAFSGCDSLISITIPNNVLSVGMYAFAGCDSLTSVTIGNGISTIEDWAFNCCESLNTIAIGSSVTTIRKEAFRSCSALSSIDYNGTISQWSSISKGNDWNLFTGNYIIHCIDGQITKGGTATYN